jgi:hypothetical protein
MEVVMMGGFTNPVFGGNTLIRPAIRSPNYVAGVSGWSINRDGSAELNNLTIRGVFNGTNYTINNMGLFMYSGAPVLGNLIASITELPGTDPYGNAYLSGIVSYSGATFSSLVDSNLLVGVVSQAIDAGLVGLTGGGAMFLSSPTHLADGATMALVNGSVAVTPTSSAGYPHLDIGASSAGTMAWINGAIIRSTVSGGTSTAETWHAPAYNANWAGTTTYGGLSGGLGTLRYRKDAEDNVWLLGAFVAAAGAASAVFQLPTGYRPLTANYPFPVAMVTPGGVASNAWMYVSQAGNMNINSQLGSSIVATNAYVVNAKIPLGNVA